MASPEAPIDPTTVGVLLAAGGGSRFDGASHKLLAPLRGRPVVHWALDAIGAAGFAHVVVVTGAIELDLSTTITSTTRLHEVHHPAWAAGQAGSLRRALDAAAALGATRVVVGLADQPFVQPGCWRAIAGSHERPIGVARYGVRRGNPVRLDASIWPLLPTEGDEGARSLMRLRPELVEEVACEGSAADIDTLEDLERWS